MSSLWCLLLVVFTATTFVSPVKTASLVPHQSISSSCHLAAGEQWRDQQLQQVLSVLHEVRLYHRQLSEKQLRQLVKQLQLLYDCLREARLVPSSERFNAQAAELSSSLQDFQQEHYDRQRLWNAGELKLHQENGAVWSRQGHGPTDSGNGHTDNAYSSERRPNQVASINSLTSGILDSSRGSLAQQKPLDSEWFGSDNGDWPTGNPRGTSIQQSSVMNDDHSGSTDAHTVGVAMSSPEALEQLNNLIGEVQQTLITPYQAPIGGSIQAQMVSPDFGMNPIGGVMNLPSSGNPALLSGGLIPQLTSAPFGSAGSGGRGTPMGQNCRCLTRGSMLGLIAAGVAATALTAYINTLFQQSVGKRRSGSRRIQRTDFSQVARSLLLDTCALGIQMMDRRQSDWKSIIDGKDMSLLPGKILLKGNYSSGQLLDGVRSVRQRRHLLSKAVHNNLDRKVVEFNLLDAPMRISPQDPGPALLLNGMSQKELTFLQELAPLVKNKEPASNKSYFSESSDIQTAPRDYSRYYSLGRKYDGKFSGIAFASSTRNPVEAEFLQSQSPDGYNDILHQSQNLMETTAEMPPLSSNSGYQTVSRRSSEVYSAGNGGIFPRKRFNPPVLRRPVEGLNQWKTSSHSAVTTEVVEDFLKGSLQGHQLGLYDDISSVFQVEENGEVKDSTRKGRYTKPAARSPLSRIREFFLGSWRRNGAFAPRCDCVALDSKQLGYLGSPVQSLVMSGVVLGYVVIQTLSLYSRNGRKADTALQMDDIISLTQSLNNKTEWWRKTDFSGTLSNNKIAIQHFTKLLKLVNADRFPVLGNLRRAIEAPSSECSRYYICRASRQGALAGEPISVAVPLLQIPLSWILAESTNGNLANFCRISVDSDCVALKKLCKGE